MPESGIEETVRIRDILREQLKPAVAHLDVPDTAEDINLEIVKTLLDEAGVDTTKIEEGSLRAISFSAWMGSEGEWKADHLMELRK